ncbi:DUF5707 domain-containing protein, partial [Streptomyces sp. ADI96-02]|uniref:DUF5707 domain-containing protein n=1 Tax=Streptomyces sp. ADI96-02 TaxID=1522760 RepID=UPI0013DDD269
MRIRATVAAVSGALALSAIALPAAQADENLPQAASHAAEAAQSSQTAAPSSPGAKAKKSFHAATDTPGKFTAAVVNGGKPVAVGTKAPQTYKVSVTAKDDSGVGQIFAYLWRGTSLDDPKSIGVAGNESRPSCKEVNATTSTCTMTVTFDPYVLENSNAGTWRVGAAVMTKDGELVENDSIAKTVVQRFSKLTVNASPEPVKKGKTITVTGQLSRANWDT